MPHGPCRVHEALDARDPPGGPPRIVPAPSGRRRRPVGGLDAVAEDPDDLPQFVHRGHRRVPQDADGLALAAAQVPVHLQGPGVHGDQGQLMPEAVVHVLGDPLPFPQPGLPDHHGPLPQQLGVALLERVQQGPPLGPVAVGESGSQGGAQVVEGRREGDGEQPVPVPGPDETPPTFRTKAAMNAASARPTPAMYRPEDQPTTSSRGPKPGTKGVSPAVRTSTLAGSLRRTSDSAADPAATQISRHPSPPRSSSVPAPSRARTAASATSPVVLRPDHCPGTTNQAHPAASAAPIPSELRVPDFDIASTSRTVGRAPASGLLTFVSPSDDKSRPSRTGPDPDPEAHDHAPPTITPHGPAPRDRGKAHTHDDNAEAP